MVMLATPDDNRFKRVVVAIRDKEHQWLLVFDNYDDPNLPGTPSPTRYDIRSFFPMRSQGSMIIIFRSTKLTFSKRLRLPEPGDINIIVGVVSRRSREDVLQHKIRCGHEI